MKSTTEIQTYLDLDGHKEQTPNKNPTALDVYSHIRFLGKGLALAGTRVEQGGYAFIIDSLIEWRHRIGDPTATIPTKPILPNKPNNSNTGKWKRYEIIEKELKEFNVINKQALKYIQAKYPTMLIDMEDPIYACLPSDLTPRQAFQHMLDSLLDKRTERALFIKVQKQMASLDYTPNSVGPKEYMRDLLDLHFKARQLHNAGTIDRATLYTYAIEAFRRGGHDTSIMRKLEDDWYTKDNQLQTAHTLELQANHDTLLQDHATAMATALDEDTMAEIEPVPPLVLTEKDIIRDFIAYWTKHLARLHQDAPPKSRANMVTAAEVVELRTQIGDLITDQQTLAQAYNAVIQQPPPDIPSVASTNP